MPNIPDRTIENEFAEQKEETYNNEFLPSNNENNMLVDIMAPCSQSEEYMCPKKYLILTSFFMFYGKLHKEIYCKRIVGYFNNFDSILLFYWFYEIICKKWRDCMKKERKCIVAVISVISLFLIPCFPFVVCWGINGISLILSKHNLEFILKIDQPLSISFGDYCSIILALLSCYITALLGWITYKLSISISQHDLRAENTMKMIIKQNIRTEINNNINIIENIENKIDQDYGDISTKQYSWVVDSNNIHLLSDNISELTLISNLYAFFENYKAKSVLKNEKDEWLIYNEQESIFKFKEIDFI